MDRFSRIPLPFVISKRYQVLEQIGSGGEALIFRAADLINQQAVVLRLPRFRQESRPLPAQKYLTPDGCSIHTARTWAHLFSWQDDPDEGTFQVWEYLPGPSLSRCISQAKVLPLAQGLGLIDDSLDAVFHLHQAGLVHGDIHGDNFVRVEGQQGVAWKLCDLPQYSFEPELRQRPLFGRIETIAPERFAGSKPSFGSDLYALGCLYYHAFSGRYPHSGVSPALVAIDHLRFAAPDLKTWNTSAPGQLSDWIMDLLVPSLRERVSSIERAGARFQRIRLGIAGTGGKAYE